MDIENVSFEESMTEILKLLLTEFQAIPIRIDGKLELAFWTCGNCSNFYKNEVEGVKGNCRGDPFGSKECCSKFRPINLKKLWIEELADYITDSQRHKRYYKYLLSEDV